MEFVDDTERQWDLWADDGQVDLLLNGKLRELLNIIDFDRDIGAERGRPRVSRRDEQLLDARTLLEFPRQRVFASTIAND